MEEFEMTESIIKQQQKNEFLDQSFNYQICPYCDRNFFIGKLKYHLKLCSSHNPMTKSPLRKTKRNYLVQEFGKSEVLLHQQDRQQPREPNSPQIKYKKCQFCRATFPLSMIQKHFQKCSFKPHIETNPQQIINKQKSKTKIDFNFKKDIKQPSSALPRIRNSARQQKTNQRKFISQDLKQMGRNYTVKIREQLSCFKKALEIQQIQCPFCTRKFSKEASLRHIPICQKLKNQQIQSIVIKKHSKSQIYKISVPVKKSTLFRSKFIIELNEKSKERLIEAQVKSARVFDSEFSNNLQQSISKRQQKSKTPMTVNKKQKKQIQLQKLFQGKEFLKNQYSQLRILNKQKTTKQKEQHIIIQQEKFDERFKQQITKVQSEQIREQNDMNMTFSAGFMKKEDKVIDKVQQRMQQKNDEFNGEKEIGWNEENKESINKNQKIKISSDNLFKDNHTDSQIMPHEVNLNYIQTQLSHSNIYHWDKDQKIKVSMNKENSESQLMSKIAKSNNSQEQLEDNEFL